MSRTSIPKHSVRAAAAAVVLAGLLSPADATAIFPDLPTNPVPVHQPIVLTSRLPWMAPVGHRQPHQADVPRHEAVAGWEQQQQQSDRELDRKLVICRGC